MARNLTKVRKRGLDKGNLYKRPDIIEADIDVALLQSNDDIFMRLVTIDIGEGEYLRSECLVHLMRTALANENDALFNSILTELLKRCEKTLKYKISSTAVPDAETLREEILQDFAMLFIEDRHNAELDELDFYECKFNLAFRSLYGRFLSTRWCYGKTGSRLTALPQTRPPLR